MSLSTNEQLAQHNLLYLQDYRLLICTLCRSGLCPGAGSTVLRVQNHFYHRPRHEPFTSTQTKTLKSLLPSLSISSPVEFDSTLSWDCAPIPGIRVDDGYCCNICPNFALKARRLIQEHARLKHPSQIGLGSFTSCRVQSFFLKPKIWFRVNESHSRGDATQSVSLGAGSDGSCTQIQITDPETEEDRIRNQEVRRLWQEGLDFQKEEEDKARDIVGPVVTNTHITPFLNRVGWTVLLAERDMSDVRPHVELPKPSETRLSLVMAAIDMMFREVNFSLNQMPDHVRFRLASIDKKSNTLPWRAVQPDTEKKYAVLWKCFIAYLLRLKMRSQFALENAEISLTPEASRLLDSVVKEIDRQELADEKQPSWDLSSLLTQLSSALILYELDIKALSHPIHNFLAVSAWRPKDRRFQHPTEYRQTSAALIWCCRVLIYMDTYGHSIFGESSSWNPPIGHEPSEDRLALAKRFDEKRLKYMVADSSHSPMGELFSRHSYAKSLGTSDSFHRQAWFDGDRLNLDSLQVPVADLLKCIHTLVTEATLALRQLIFQDLDFCTPSFMRQLVDHMECSDNGFSFTEISRNSVLIAPFMLSDRVFPDRRSEHGESSSSVAIPEFLKTSLLQGEDGQVLPRVVWNLRVIERYAADVSRFLGKLWVLIHTTSGQPARGPEINSIQHCNTAVSLRNIFVLGGKLIIVTSYSKSQNITQTARVVCRTPPFEVGRLLYLYLALVRPFLSVLMSFVNRERRFQVRSEYLFCDVASEMKTTAAEPAFGSIGSNIVFVSKHWDTDKITALLKQTTGRLVGVEIAILQWRHIAIALSRRFLPSAQAFDADVPGMEVEKKLQAYLGRWKGGGETTLHS